MHVRRGSPLCVKTDLDPEGQFVRRTAVYTAIERPSPPHTRTPAAVSSAASARLACREYQEHPPHAPLPARRLLAAARTPKVAMPVGLQPAVRRSERLPPEALPSAVSPLCSPRRERRDRCPSAARLPRTRPSPCACATWRFLRGGRRPPSPLLHPNYPYTFTSTRAGVPQLNALFGRTSAAKPQNVVPFAQLIE